MTDAHSFLGKIRSKMIMWKITNEKVILNTAEVPKQALAAPSLLIEFASALTHVNQS